MRSQHHSSPRNSEQLLDTLERQAVAFERGGNWASAAGVYQAIFREAWARKRVDVLADSLRKAARVNHLWGRPEEAAELALLSLEVADRNHIPQIAGRVLNLLGLLEHAQGRFVEAGALYEIALSRARDAGDAELIGAACQNLGVLANMRGDLEEARARYFECIGSVLRSGDRSAAMGIYNNLGMVCSDLGDWLEAEVYLSRGIEIAEQVGDRAMLGRLRVNYAEPLIRVGEYEEARKSLDQGERLLEEVGDRRGLSDAARLRGIIARALGDHRTAAVHLDRALRTAEAAHLQLEAAEALEEIALLRRDEDRAGPARVTAEEALRIYRELGAARDVTRLRESVSKWSPPKGEPPPTTSPPP